MSRGFESHTLRQAQSNKQNGKDFYVLAAFLLVKLIIKLTILHTFYANIKNIFYNG